LLSRNNINLFNIWFYKKFEYIYYMNNKINRRDFMKQLGIAWIWLAISNSVFANLLEDKEIVDKPNIISRKDRDDLRNQLHVQYDKKLWEWFTVEIEWVKYNRMVNVLPYLDSNLQRENLQKVYKRIIVHHSAIDPIWDYLKQAKDLRDLELSTMWYSDIAYHFLITSDWEIIEARPCFRIWAHAGSSKEFNVKAWNILPWWLQNLASMNSKEYKDSLIKYLDAIKLDPDYGSLWICLCGNFENIKPKKQQLSSLHNLLNRLKYEYQVPWKNIIFHKDVKSEIIEKSGLTFDGKETVCPWSNFDKNDLNNIIKNLDPDLPWSQNKSLLLK